MMEDYGVAASELRLVGGGSKNKLWRKIIADSFQLPIRFPTEPESAALGGALQAAAVYNQEPVADYITAHEPGTTDEVSLHAAGTSSDSLSVQTICKVTRYKNPGSAVPDADAGCTCSVPMQAI